MKPIGNQKKRMIYQIRVKGVLDPSWSEWFDGMTITPQTDGRTLLTGPVRDQSALHGLLVKLRDLGMTILSFESVSNSNNSQE
jgi:hypothetical protein